MLSPPPLDGLQSYLAYASLSAALLVGALLTVRVRRGAPGSSLVLIPLLVGQWRFGIAILPPLLLAAALAPCLRGQPRRVAATSAVMAGLSYGAGALLGQAVSEPDVLSLALFAIAFSLTGEVLYRLAVARGWLAADDPRSEQPSALLSLLVAPLAAFPIVAGQYLGDGGSLLALAALLVLLVVVREAVNLATAREEAEAERDRLARAHELQDELVDLIVHDVKNPLTTVLLYTQLADDALHGAPDRASRVERYLERVQRAGRAIERLVNNLLLLKHFVSSDELPPSEAVDVSAMAREVVAELEPLAERKEQTMVLDVPEGTPRAKAPALLLREALVNLVSNAVKYTPSGGHITLSAGEAEPAMVAITVTDTGVGLSPDDQERIFAKFYRSDDPRVGGEGGWGLGLTLTRSIIERMGGRITVESSLNEGASFRILLPVAAAGI